jgi:cytoskeletal protein CcmA (bactofilin family)
MFSRKGDAGGLKPPSLEESDPAKAFGPVVTESSREKAVIGRSIIIKGEVTGQEDLVVEGTIEGRIHLDNQHVTVGPSGRVSAEVKARLVTIEGEVLGNIQAREKVIITAKGSLTGDIQAARLKVEDGAYLKGTVSLSPREKDKAIPITRPGAVVERKDKEGATGA